MVEEKGNYTIRATLDKKMDTASEQWKYARRLQNDEKLRKAERGMLYLVRRWPNSVEAPFAQRAMADILYSRKKLKEAFKAYQYLIDNYSSRMLDYDEVLESQFQIAVELMNRRRIRWILGGFKAPEQAVSYFEDVIRNGPQWDRAPESQFSIGKAYQQADELELAITAYSVLGYRYPDSEFAEEALWNKIVCIEKLHKEIPNSHDILERMLTSTTVFLSTYPESRKRKQVIAIRNKLYETKAGKAFDEAAFYAKVPKKPEAAILYYKQMIAEFPKSQLVPDANERIAELEKIVAGQHAPAGKQN